MTTHWVFELRETFTNWILIPTLTLGCHSGGYRQIETHDFSVQCEELTGIQLAALNASVVSVIAQLQKKGTLPLTICFMKAEPSEYEFEFIPDGLEGMEPEGSA